MSKKSKQRKFLSEEVCWGLTIAANFGFSKAEAIDSIWDDFMKWADLAMEEGDCDVLEPQANAPSRIR